MSGYVWFGTKAHMQWVTAPAVDITAGKVGYNASANFLNGGAWHRRSKTSAKQYALSWNMKHADEVQPILDYADGVYGNGFVYYVDPFIAERNVLPAYVANPSMNAYDGPWLAGGERPTLVTHASSTNGYPTESAQYTITSSATVPSVFIPIPEDHTVYVGAHGSVQSGNARVTVTPVISSIANGTPVDLTLLAVTDDRTNASWSYSSGIIGVEISMASSSTGVIQLDGLIAQVAPDGAVLPSGGFISGQGSSGMSITEQPAMSQYSAALDRVGVSMSLLETEAWTWR